MLVQVKELSSLWMVAVLNQVHHRGTDNDSQHDLRPGHSADFDLW
jgi:hypothetical protein